jgi:hypothetical protein
MKNEKPSSEMAAFRELVQLDVPIKSVKWEIFGTPEYSGGVPGPTDYITLIAEVESSDDDGVQQGQPTGVVWIAPEAARPWLTEGFREMLAKNRGNDADLSSAYKCRRLQAKIKKDKTPVYGFICSDSGKSLIYLTLQENTAS